MPSLAQTPASFTPLRISSFTRSPSSLTSQRSRSFVSRGSSAQLRTHAQPSNVCLLLKMVQDQGIEVYLAPSSDITKRYKEYSIPTTSPSFTGNPNEVYIEAVDGERFVIVADTWNITDVKGRERLKISCQTDSADDPTGPWRCDFAYAGWLPFGSPIQGRYIYTCQRQIQEGEGTCGNVFVPLQIGESLQPLPSNTLSVQDTNLLEGDEELTHDEVK